MIAPDIHEGRIIDFQFYQSILILIVKKEDCLTHNFYVTHNECATYNSCKLKKHDY